MTPGTVPFQARTIYVGQKILEWTDRLAGNTIDVPAHPAESGVDGIPEPIQGDST
jgi:hypothetical protein